MTVRPLVMTLVLDKRLGELKSALSPLRDYSLAACSDENSDLFFSELKTDIQNALAICQNCPIRRGCLEDAIANHEFGVWGGTTEDMRKQMDAINKSKHSRSDGTDLPSRHEVANEIKTIINKPVSNLCEIYRVEPRTIYRWRRDLKGDFVAMQLIESGE